MANGRKSRDQSYKEKLAAYYYFKYLDKAMPQSPTGKRFMYNPAWDGPPAMVGGGKAAYGNNVYGPWGSGYAVDPYANHTEAELDAMPYPAQQRAMGIAPFPYDRADAQNEYWFNRWDAIDNLGPENDQAYDFFGLTDRYETERNRQKRLALQKAWNAGPGY